MITLLEVATSWHTGNLLQDAKLYSHP